MKLSHAAATDPGPVRPRNEDAFGFHLPARLFVVADGLGGHERGDEASELAVRSVTQQFERALAAASQGDASFPATACKWLLEAVQIANQRVHDEPGDQSRRMGATLVAAHFTGCSVVIAHAGDCRCYRLRAGELQLLTRDHSLLEDLRERALDERDLKALSQYSHIVTRAVGIEADIDVDSRVTDALAGDVFLLCSDGLWGAVGEEELVECIEPGPPLDQRCNALLRAAAKGGSQDNITSILVAVER